MQRKKYSPDFKAKVALEAIQENRTTAEMCSQYGIHSTMLGRWRQQAIEHIKTGFSERTEKQEEIIAQLYQQIGQLKVELDWLKKNLLCSNEHKGKLIEPGNERISIKRQCELIGLERSSYYYLN